MVTRLIAWTALFLAATAIVLLAVFADATGIWLQETDTRLQELEAPTPTWTGPAERQA